MEAHVIIGALQAVMVAIIGGLFTRDAKIRKKVQDKDDKRAEIRAEESLLSMRLMSANNNLTVATALAVRDGKTNGKMTDALREAEAAQREYYDFINNIASKQMAAH